MDSTFSLNSGPTLNDDDAALSTPTLFSGASSQVPLRHQSSFYAAGRTLLKHEASFYTISEPPLSPRKQDTFYAGSEQPKKIIEEMIIEAPDTERAQEKARATAVDIPDGGLRAWLTVFGGYVQFSSVHSPDA